MLGVVCRFGRRRRGLGRRIYRRLRLIVGLWAKRVLQYRAKSRSVSFKCYTPSPLGNGNCQSFEGY